MAAKIIAFLLGNVTWLLPSIAALGLGVDAGVQHIRVANRDATIAKMEKQKAQDIAAAEQAVRKALQADAARSNQLVLELAVTKAELQGSLQDALVRQAAAAAGPPECNHTADTDAFDWSLRHTGSAPGKAGAGQPPAPGRAHDPVPP